MGRHARARRGRRGSGAGQEPHRSRRHGVVPRARRPRRPRADGCARRRGRGLRRRGPCELRAVAAAVRRDRAPRGRGAISRGPGPLRRVRPAAPRWRRLVHAAVPPATGAPRVARGRGAHVAHHPQRAGRRRGMARRGARPAHRGRHGEAVGQRLRAGSPVRVVAEGEAAPRAGVRGVRMDAGVGAEVRRAGLPRARVPRSRWPPLGRQRGHGVLRRRPALVACRAAGDRDHGVTAPPAARRRAAPRPLVRTPPGRPGGVHGADRRRPSPPPSDAGRRIDVDPAAVRCEE